MDDTLFDLALYDLEDVTDDDPDDGDVMTYDDGLGMWKPAASAASSLDEAESLAFFMGT